MGWMPRCQAGMRGSTADEKRKEGSVEGDGGAAAAGGYNRLELSIISAQDVQKKKKEKEKRSKREAEEKEDGKKKKNREGRKSAAGNDYVAAEAEMEYGGNNNESSSSSSAEEEEEEEEGGGGGDNKKERRGYYAVAWIDGMAAAENSKKKKKKKTEVVRCGEEEHPTWNAKVEFVVSDGMLVWEESSAALNLEVHRLRRRRRRRRETLVGTARVLLSTLARKGKGYESAHSMALLLRPPLSSSTSYHHHHHHRALLNIGSMILPLDHHHQYHYNSSASPLPPPVPFTIHPPPGPLLLDLLEDHHRRDRDRDLLLHHHPLHNYLNPPPPPPMATTTTCTCCCSRRSFSAAPSTTSTRFHPHHHPFFFSSSSSSSSPCSSADSSVDLFHPRHHGRLLSSSSLRFSLDYCSSNTSASASAAPSNISRGNSCSAGFYSLELNDHAAALVNDDVAPPDQDSLSSTSCTFCANPLMQQQQDPQQLYDFDAHLVDRCSCRYHHHYSVSSNSTIEAPIYRKLNHCKWLDVQGYHRRPSIDHLYSGSTTAAAVQSRPCNIASNNRSSFEKKINNSHLPCSCQTPVVSDPCDVNQTRDVMNIAGTAASQLAIGGSLHGPVEHAQQLASIESFAKSSEDKLAAGDRDSSSVVDFAADFDDDKELRIELPKGQLFSTNQLEATETLKDVRHVIDGTTDHEREHEHGSFTTNGNGIIIAPGRGSILCVHRLMGGEDSVSAKTDAEECHNKLVEKWTSHATNTTTTSYGLHEFRDRFIRVPDPDLRLNELHFCGTKCTVIDRHRRSAGDNGSIHDYAIGTAHSNDLESINGGAVGIKHSRRCCTHRYDSIASGLKLGGRRSSKNCCAAGDDIDEAESAAAARCYSAVELKANAESCFAAADLAEKMKRLELEEGMKGSEDGGRRRQPGGRWKGPKWPISSSSGWWWRRRKALGLIDGSIQTASTLN